MVHPCRICWAGVLTLPHARSSHEVSGQTAAELPHTSRSAVPAIATCTACTTANAPAAQHLSRIRPADDAVAIHPIACEVCDDIDDNCNGVIDDGAGGQVYYQATASAWAAARRSARPAAASRR